MAKSLAEKLAQKKQQLIERTTKTLDIPEPEAIKYLSTTLQQSLRVNTIKSTDRTISSLKELGWQGEPYDWIENGYSITAGLDAIKKSPQVASGEVYIQNAASWLPVLVLGPQPEETILDVCAAPGGKTSHIAAMASNKAHITVNDNSRPRLARLRANLDRLGVRGVEYTLYDASQLARKLEGRQFDKILLDAPCSGEGMMTLESDKDFETWSVAHIKRLQQLQKRIIVQAWELLKPGGTLVYSTCTMAPEENEAVIDYLLRRQEDVIVDEITIDMLSRVKVVTEWNGRTFNHNVSQSMRLIPSDTTEAFFVCKMTKSLSEVTYKS